MTCSALDEFILRNGDTKQLLLGLLLHNPQLTVKQISDKMKINERNVKKNIIALKEAGMLERIGSTRKGYWLVSSSHRDSGSKI